MTKLEKWLFKNANEMIKSDTTNSKYFRMKNISIRVSDHISFKGNFDLQIIIPNNPLMSGLYTVLFGESYKTLIWNAKQILEFVPSMILMKEMQTKSVFKPDNKHRTTVQKIELAKQPIQQETSSLIFNSKIESKIKLKYTGAVERKIIMRDKATWNSNEISNLSQLMHREFGRGDSINDDFQIFLNCTSVDYTDVINIYKIIVIDNNKTPTIHLLQEAYNMIK